MAKRALLRGLVSCTRYAIALIFSSQSLLAQAPSASAVTRVKEQRFLCSGKAGRKRQEISRLC